MTARIWKDRVQQTVTGTPGTGAFTLSTAVANYQALAAGDDAKAGCFVATEGTAWETFKDGLYTHSSLNLTRGTFTGSSTGSAISFTSAAVVFLDIIATMAAQFDAPTNLITGTDAATTMVANATYVVDMSAWATADRNYTLPASPSVGDRVRIAVQAGNASFELIYKGNTSQTIDGGSTATERSRLMITGECVELLYVASNTWLTSYDGRIPMHGAMHLSTSCTGETAGTYTYPTAKSGVWTVDKDVGGVCTAASDKITSRRACGAIMTVTGFPNSGGTLIYSIVFELNGGATIYPFNLGFYPGGSSQNGMSGSRSFVFALDDYVRYQIWTSSGSRGALGAASGYVSMSMVEVLS